MARSSGVYDRVLMKTIHRLKYNGKIQLAGPLGMLLFVTFIHCWANETIDWIIPVPLHAKRMRKRGFNPSFLLVRNWAYYANAMQTKRPCISVDRNTLVRKRWTEPQTGLVRTQRMANIKNAFGINAAMDIIGKRILLVDDVFTTGATVDECAKVLLHGGAERVDVLTLARAV